MTPEVSFFKGSQVMRIRRLVGEFFWIGFGQALAAVGALVGVRWLTQVLNPGEYGELALGITAATLVQQVLMGPLSGAAARFFAPAHEVGQGHAYLIGVWKLLKAAGLVLTVTTLSVTLFIWVWAGNQWVWVILAASLFALLSGFSSTLDGMQNAARQRAVVAWHQGIGQWLRFAMGAALVVVLGERSYLALFGYALAGGIVLCSQSVFFRRLTVKDNAPQDTARLEEIEHWARLMREYAWPFAAWGLFTWAQMASDRWALKTFATTREVGIYSVLYQLGFYPVSMLSGLMVQFVSPVLFQRAGDGTDPGRMDLARRLNWNLIKACLVTTLFGTGMAFFLHKIIFSVLAAPAYRSVSALLPLMVMSGGLFATGQIASLQSMTDVQVRVLMAPKVVTALMGIMLNIAGAYYFGLHGVVMAGVVFSTLYLLWVLYLNRTTTIAR